LATQVDTLEAQNSALATRVADLAAQNLRQGREITALFATAVKLFGAETIKLLETNVNEIGEVFVKFFPGMMWN
jgi:hypothetical protein